MFRGIISPSTASTLPVCDDAGDLSLKWLYGWSAKTAQFITNSVISYVCGNHIVFFNLEDNQIEKIFTIPGSGIEEYDANKIDALFAFSEICANPNIYVHRYSDFEQVCELTDGAELEFKGINFSWEDHLISLSGTPDYKITIWQWTNAQKLCSVIVGKSCNPRISFNPCNWRNVCTLQKGVIIWWDIYHYITDFVFVSRKINIPQTNVKKKSFGQVSYEGLKMPEMELDPHGKYKINREKNNLESETEPTTHCWLFNGDLLVGTMDGEIWKIDGEKQQINLLWSSVDFNDSVSNTTPLHITCIIYHLVGLYIGTAEGWLIKLKFGAGKKAKILSYKSVNNRIIRLHFGLSYDRLLIACENNSIFLSKINVTGDEDEDPVMLNHQMLKVVYAEMLPPRTRFIVALLEDNTVLTLYQETKEVIASLKMPETCTCLSCSPLWHGAAIGTISGCVYILGFSKQPNPRIIHATALDHWPIKMMRFDISGVFLCVVCKTKVFFLSGRPSNDFCIFGYIDINGEVLDVCSIQKSNNIHFLILHKDPDRIDGEIFGGTLFTRIQLQKFMLPSEALGQINIEGNFPDGTVNRRMWLSTHPCIGVSPDQNDNVWYTFIGSHKHLMKFSLPDFFKSYESASKEIQKLSLLDLHKSKHELADAVLVSNDGSQIVTVGNDGRLVCRYTMHIDTVSYLHLDHFLSPTCKCKVFLSRSGTNILVVTSQGYLLLYSWALPSTSSDADLYNIRQYKEPVKEFSDCSVENMAAGQKSAYLISTLLVTDTSVLSFFESTVSIHRPISPMLSTLSNVSSQSESDDVVPWPNLDFAWIDGRVQMRFQLDSEDSVEQIAEIRKTVKQLGYKVAKLLVENDLLPESEQIPRQDFDLDREVQIQLLEENRTKLAKIRETNTQQNMTNNYLWITTRKECWDAMKVKGTTLKAFFRKIDVSNFPLRERTREEQELYDCIMLKRTIELESHKSLVKQGVATKVNWRVSKSDVLRGEAEDVDPALRMIHMGSQSVTFGIDNPNFYSQFEVYSPDQKHSQIVLIQDAIYRLKERFNQHFNDVFAKKKVAIEKIVIRNSRMQQIVNDIKLPIDLWIPTWSVEEKPEECLVVRDSEIKSEKYYSPEQQAAMELKRKEDEEIRKKKMEDDFRLRAVGKMMGGVLQSRKEDEIFHNDVPIPAFALKKSPEQFNADEKAAFSAYQQKVKDLHEERDKLRKQLEAEFSRCNESVQEIANTFDDEMKELMKKKLKAQDLVYQEELKILRLNLMLEFEAELDTQHKNLIKRLAELKTNKAKIQSKVIEIQRTLLFVHDRFDTIVVEDRLQEKIFKKEFGDLPVATFETLQKLFRKKPRVQKNVVLNPVQPPTGNVQNPYGNGPFGEKLLSNVLVNYATSLKELDDRSFAPEGLVFPNQWSQFCQLRRTKIDLEYQVRHQAMVIADMMAYLQSQQTKNEAISKEVGEIHEMTLKLAHDRRTMMKNLDVQLVLKHGQVELNSDGYLPDYRGALLIHRSVVEDRNNQIKTLGGIKIDSMMENIRLESQIELQKWEHKNKQMKIEDLVNDFKEIQKMQVTREIRHYLENKDKISGHSLQMVKLDEQMFLLKKLHDKRRIHAEKTIKQAEEFRQLMLAKNVYYEDKLHRLNTVLNRWRLIPKAEEDPGFVGAKKFEQQCYWRDLVRKAVDQQQEILALEQQINNIVERSIPNLPDD